MISSTSKSHRSALGTILAAGLAAGALDLLFAFTFYGIRNGIAPLRILQTIGSGVFGTDSFTMGWTSGAVGLVCHFVILIVAAALFFFAARRLTLLVTQPLLSGVAYGVVIYLVMNFIVVPLSAAPHFGRSLTTVTAEMCSHVFFVGLSIAYLVKRYYTAAR